MGEGGRGERKREGHSRKRAAIISISRIIKVCNYSTLWGVNSIVLCSLWTWLTTNYDIKINSPCGLSDGCQRAVGRGLTERDEIPRVESLSLARPTRPEIVKKADRERNEN